MNVTPQERLALGAMALLLAAGGAARALHGGPAPVEWDGGSAVEPAAAALLAAVEDSTGRAQARSRPLGPGERLDPNRAGADELDRLPGVGPALAARIVARRAQGRYRTLGDLDQVPGIGPAMLGRIAEHLTLSPGPPTGGAPSPPRVAAAASGPGQALDLNRATAAEFEALPGVGPALAARIVEWRASNGRFRTVDDLEKVPGIGPATLTRLRGRLRATP